MNLVMAQWIQRDMEGDRTGTSPATVLVLYLGNCMLCPGSVVLLCLHCFAAVLCLLDSFHLSLTK